MRHRAPWRARRIPPMRIRRERALAAQWMVVFRPGLTAISGDDGVHALVQFAWLRRAARRRRTQAGWRATTKYWRTKNDRRRRRVQFRSGLSRGRAARRRDFWSPRSPATTASLSLAQNAFDLSDRGVTGRIRPRALTPFPQYRALASIAPVRPCSPRRFCAAPRPWRNPACR